MVHSLRTVVPLMLALVLAACSTDEGGETAAVDDFDEGSCRFRGELSGDRTTSLPGNEDVACAYPHGIDDGLSSHFLVPTEGVESIELEIVGITEGAIGDFDAKLSVRFDDDSRFTGRACRVSVSSHEKSDHLSEEPLAGRAYRVRGKGSCSEPLLASDESGRSIQVAPFDFVTGTVWR